jgi:hypothetical protein
LFGYILGRNCLPKRVIEGKIEGQEDDEEELSSYQMTLRKR